MSNVALSVNLNKIALIRNSRGSVKPNPCVFAHSALDAGANGITVHPRPDERHIRKDDVMALAQLCKQRKTELNIEGNPFSVAHKNYLGFIKLVEQARPEQCTLVPDTPQQLTSDSGFEPSEHNANRLEPIIAQLRDWNCRVSIFSNPETEAVDFASAIGAHRIELYTGPYAHTDQDHQKRILERYAHVADTAKRARIGINAGHDLNLLNLGTFVEAIDALDEVSIGHALISDALEMGFEQAVRAYCACLARD